MAVFPDRIVLKHSPSSESNVLENIKKDGFFEITPGELVIYQGDGYAKLFTLDVRGDVVEVTDTAGVSGYQPPYVEATLLVNRDTGFVDKPLRSLNGTPYWEFYGSTATPATDSPATGDGYTQLLGGDDDFALCDLDTEDNILIEDKVWTLEFWYRSNYDPITDPTPDRAPAIFGSAENNTFRNFFVVNDPVGGAVNTTNPETRAGAIILTTTLFNAEYYVTGTVDADINDGEWHWISMSHEGAGFYSTFVDGVLKERRQNAETTIPGGNEPTGVTIHWPSNLQEWWMGNFYASHRGDANDDGDEFKRPVCDLDGLAFYIGISKYNGRDSFEVPGAPSQNWGGSLYIPTIDLIEDVNTSGYPLNTGDALIWDASIERWIPGQPGAQTLAALQDVDLTATPLQNGDVLGYNSASGKWENTGAPAYDISSNDLQDIGNVQNGTPTNGQVLSWDSGAEEWQFETVQLQGATELNDLSDVERYNGTDLISFFDADGLRLWHSQTDNAFDSWFQLENSQRDGYIYYSPAYDTEINVGWRYRILFQTSRETNNYIGLNLWAEKPGEANLEPVLRFGVSPTDNADSPPAQLRLYRKDDLNGHLYMGLRGHPEQEASYLYTFPKEDGQQGAYLQTDGLGNLTWANESYEPPAGYVASESGPGVHPLTGSSTVYDTRLDMEAAGFTYIVNSEDIDDAVIRFDVPAELRTLQFGNLNNPAPREWFINPNGGLGYDVGGQVTTSKNGSVTQDGYAIDFYVGLWSQDSLVKRAGTKLINENGRIWFVVRIDFILPADELIDGGFPVEVWLSDKADVSVRYGTCSQPGFFLTGNARNGVVSNGLWVADMAIPGQNQSQFFGLTSLGDYVYNAATYDSDSLGSLSDVDMSDPPEVNNVLTWDGLSWIPKNPAYGEGNTDGGSGGAVWINDLADVNTEIVAPQIGDSLRWDGFQWIPREVYVPSTVNELADVDTVTDPPIDGEALVYDASNLVWKPGIPNLPEISVNDLSDVDTATRPPEPNQSLVWDGTQWVPGDTVAGNIEGGTGGQIAGTVNRVTEVQATDGDGYATYTQLSQSGKFVRVSTASAAWITFYSSSVARLSDSGRQFGQDPDPSAGVLAEFYLEANEEVSVTPAVFYFNDDNTPQDALYVCTRDLNSQAVQATVQVVAYAHQTFAGYGTNRVTDSTLVTGGFGTIDGMGQSGQLISISSDEAAWVTVYTDPDFRLADLNRQFGTEAPIMSGIVFDGFIAATQVVEITPGAPYANSDDDPTAALYVFARNPDDNSALRINLTTVGYAETNYTSISGGTFGSG